MKRASVTHSLRTSVIVPSILVCTIGLCAQANAQSWLPDRSYKEGPGIRVGNLELHPGIAVRAGYDTNVFRTDDDEVPALASGLISVTPHLHLSTLQAQRKAEGEDAGGTAEPKIAFDGGISATYFQYTKAAAQPDDEITIGLDLDGTLKILPTRPVNLEILAGYNRSVLPFTDRVVDANYTNNQFNPGVKVNFGSRSRVVNSFVSYAPRITYYEKDTPFRYLNNVNHAVALGQSWKFLPRTALLYDAELSLQDYWGDDPSTATTLVTNGRYFATRLGMNGALTEKLSLRLFAGYALMVFDHDAMSEYENAIGEAILTFRFGESSHFDVGYQGLVQPSAAGGWMRTDRGIARTRMLFAGVFLLGLEASAGYVTYGRMLRPLTGPAPAGATGDFAETPVGALGKNGTTERDDVRFDGAVRGEYRVTNWLAFMADYTIVATLTDFEYNRTGNARPQPFPAEFIDHEIHAGVRAHY